jgi:L-alanine-DL-glutamate epimerase-like enolase superfamily enzyme
MQITRLTTAVVEANYDWILVRVEDSEGQYGLGESYMGPGVPAIVRELSSLLIDADPSNPERLLRRLRGATVHASPGAVDHALAGIETAIFDLLGKAYGLPVWKLLGGQYQNKIRIYADCHAGDALESLSPLLEPRVPSWSGGGMGKAGDISLKHHGWNPEEQAPPAVEDYRRRAREMAARGFTALKFDADIPTPFPTDQYNRSLSPAEIEYVVERLRAVREEIGRDIGLAVDCHWNYTVADAIRLARALEPLDLLWYEDPVPPSPIAPLAEVQAATTIPVATGENHYKVEDFLDLMTTGRVRVLAPDVQKTGISRTKFIAQLADMRFTNLAIHNISSPVGLMAAAHVAASIPNFLALEWHGASVPFYEQLLTAPLIENGWLTVTDRPGLGVELNETVARNYRKESEPFFS